MRALMPTDSTYALVLHGRVVWHGSNPCAGKLVSTMALPAKGGRKKAEPTRTISGRFTETEVDAMGQARADVRGKPCTFGGARYEPSDLERDR